MKKSFIHAIVFSLSFIIAFGIAYATQPGQDINPNGFPSGPHFNLNVHGKNSNFSLL
jgi:hypothetical protein